MPSFTRLNGQAPWKRGRSIVRYLASDLWVMAGAALALFLMESIRLPSLAVAEEPAALQTLPAPSTRGDATATEPPLRSSAADAGYDLPVTLEFHGVPGCSDATVFWSELSALSPSARNSAPLQVFIRLEGTPELGFHLRLEVPDGHREYSGGSCRPLIQAAALFVSLLLEEGSTSAAPVTPPDKKSAPTPAPLPPAPSRPKLQPFFALAWGADIGSFPRATHLGTASLGAQHGDYSLRLRAHWTPRESLDVEEGPLHLGWFGAGVLACYSLLRGDLGRVAGCLGIDAGQIDFSAPRAEAPNQGSLALVSSALATEAAWSPDRHFALTLAAEWSQPLLAARVYLRDTPEDRLVSESTSALRIRLGLEVPF